MKHINYSSFFIGLFALVAIQYSSHSVDCSVGNCTSDLEEVSFIVKDSYLDASQFSLKNVLSRIVENSDRNTLKKNDVDTKVKALFSSLLQSLRNLNTNGHPDTHTVHPDFPPVTLIKDHLELSFSHAPKDGNTIDYYTELLLGERTDMDGRSFALVPTAIVNRFDFSIVDVESCGEYRIVYTFPRHIIDETFNLIFEGRLPRLSAKNRGELNECDEIYRLWASFSEITKTGTNEESELYIRESLDKLFFEGYKSVNKELEYFPILNWENFTGNQGLNGESSGHIRANLKLSHDQEWTLREWGIKKTGIPGVGTELMFKESTTNNSVPVNYYLDSNVSNNLAFDFKKSVIGIVEGQLFDPNRRALVKKQQFEKLSNAQFVINNLSATSQNSHNAVQTNSTNKRINDRAIDIEFDTEMLIKAVSKRVAKFEGNLLEGMEKEKLKSILQGGRAGEIFVNRFFAMSCSGCHHLMQGKAIDIDDTDVNQTFPIEWPRNHDCDAPIVSFVHIRNDGALSCFLRNFVLPFREELLINVLKDPNYLDDWLSSNYENSFYSTLVAKVHNGFEGEQVRDFVKDKLRKIGVTQKDASDILSDQRIQLIERYDPVSDRIDFFGIDSPNAWPFDVILNNEEGDSGIGESLTGRILYLNVKENYNVWNDDEFLNSVKNNASMKTILGGRRQTH